MRYRWAVLVAFGIVVTANAVDRDNHSVASATSAELKSPSAPSAGTRSAGKTTVVLGGTDPAASKAMLARVPNGTPAQVMLRALLLINSAESMIKELADLNDPKVDQILTRYHVEVVRADGRRVFPKKFRAESMHPR